MSVLDDIVLLREKKADIKANFAEGFQKDQFCDMTKIQSEKYIECNIIKNSNEPYAPVMKISFSTEQYIGEIIKNQISKSYT